MDRSYNSEYLNYIIDSFKDMMLEDTSQEKALTHQYHAYFSVLLSAYNEPHIFKKHGITKIQKNMNARVFQSERNSST